MNRDMGPEVITDAAPMNTTIRVSQDASRGWDSDLFEDQIARTVIALYERPTKIKDSDWPGINADELIRFRAKGAYVQHPNRLVFSDELDLPLEQIYSGLFVESFLRGRQFQWREYLDESYAVFNVLKRAPSIPKPFYATASGVPYCFAALTAMPDGSLESEKQFFTCKGKEVFVAAVDVPRQKRWNFAHRPAVLGGLSLAENTKDRVICLANTIADRKYQWAIGAFEDDIRVDLQCYHSEIKSLLYARSLPLTATGRKRPILHFVAAHRRRLKEGIEIDIDQFLRGVKKVEMHGTVFEVAPPQRVPTKLKGVPA